MSLYTSSSFDVGCGSLTPVQPPYHATWYNFSGHDGGSLHALPLTVIVSTIVPYRVGTALIVPADYSGIYNITDSQGNIQARRYVGEPRFVALLLNVTSLYSPDPEAILVPRSLFFQSLLYAYLSSGNPPSLVSQLRTCRTPPPRRRTRTTSKNSSRATSP